VFHDVGVHIQKIAFVFDGDEGAFGAVVLGDLEGQVWRSQSISPFPRSILDTRPPKA